jgi:23S rRNA (cytidine1920-2'-O)/16S rRNA (cytidine1409-2'-O)-methyltransferase
MKKERADRVLVERGLAPTRQKAQALIMAGMVSGPAGRIDKAGQLVDPETPLAVAQPLPFVGRGGLKLDQALDEFAVSPAGLVCADIGSSTGGFTDCLLQRGAARVFAVDVDIRQLDDRLRRDPRVVTVQKNARNLVASDFPAAPGERPSLFVMDVSFISILKILPALRAILLPGTPSPPIVLTLIKPQFEAGRGQVGKKGIVREPALHAEILARVAAEAAGLDFALRGLVRCAARGRTGNQEFFARWEPGGVAAPAASVLEWIAAATTPTARCEDPR